MSRTDFNEILLESLNESISVTVGRSMTPELLRHLQAFVGISLGDAPERTDRLFSSLWGSFGLNGDGLCRTVVEKMYRKAGMPFYEIGGKPMIQYIYDLKRELG